MAAKPFTLRPIPGEPDWDEWLHGDTGLFNEAVIGPVRARREGNTSIARMIPARRHLNEIGTIHGGATVGFIDVALFVGIRVLLDADPTSTLTLDLATQFIGAGSGDEPLDAHVEILRETGRMVFLRGTVEQSHGIVAGFSATVRKPSRK